MTGPLTTYLRVHRGGDAIASHYEEFVVPFETGATVLDGLLWIRRHHDPSLAIRYSCVSANVCKECTIAIDGRIAYACTTRLQAGRVMTLDPLPGKPLLRDLVSDTVPRREKLR